MASQAPGCAQMVTQDGPYTGDAAGALQRTQPKVLALQPDALLVSVAGSGLDTMSGQTVGGDQSQWIVTFYSAKNGRNYAGVYSGERGVVSCQQALPADPLPPTAPPPTQGSGAVMKAAIARLQADAKARNIARPMISMSNLTYGQVTIGIKPPVERSWRVDLTPWAMLVDDATGAVKDCAYTGSPCK